MRGMLRTVATSARDEEGHMSGTSDRGPAYRRWLAGRTVSVVGLARSGIAAARLIRRVGGRVLASDAGAPASLSAEAWQLEQDGCRLWTGGHPAEAFEKADLVVVSPGVPLTLPAVSAARARGVPIIGELELAWLVMEADLIAITGTNGKTTTTALTGELLRAQVRPTLVAGNIGTPLSEHALDFPADGLVVAEVSSFQLESTVRFHPRVATVLNITPDHLDRHGTLERYVEAKARIFANQTVADCAFWTGMAPEAIRRGIAGFRGVEHRIERVRDDRGIVFYNDSKGTNVASTIKALESFTEPVVLIAGGKGKGQDFAPLALVARGRVRQAVLIGVDRPAIRAALEAAGVSCADATSMREAVATARSLARAGDVVLLSPACASFDMFDNFEHRGDVFMAAVHELTHA